jgi:hypothetical protein
MRSLSLSVASGGLSLCLHGRPTPVVRPDQWLASDRGVTSHRCGGRLRLGFGGYLGLGGGLSIAGRQSRHKKDDADCDAAGREHPGATLGTWHPLAPFADQRLDSLFALLLEAVGTAPAHWDRFLSKR